MSYWNSVWFSWLHEWCQQEEQHLQQKEGVQEDPTFMKFAASPCGFGPSAACSRRSRLRAAVGGKANFLCRRPSLLSMKQTMMCWTCFTFLMDTYSALLIVFLFDNAWTNPQQDSMLSLRSLTPWLQRSLPVKAHAAQESKSLREWCFLSLQAPSIISSLAAFGWDLAWLPWPCLADSMQCTCCRTSRSYICLWAVKSVFQHY